MKKLLVILTIVFSFALVVPCMPALAVVCPAGTANAGETKKNLAECDLTAVEDPAKKVTERIEKGINLGLSFVGVIAVVVIIIGGIGYITSQGDTGKSVKARTTILYGIVGLVICLLAYAIVNLVLSGVFS